MIEDIKKEIEDEQFEIDMMLPTTGGKTKLQVITVFAILNILDKYANEPDHKCERTDCAGRISKSRVIEVEKKYQAVMEELKRYLAYDADALNKTNFGILNKIQELESSIKEEK